MNCYFPAVILAVLPALAQEIPLAKVPASVRASAEATVSAQPDRARINIGVVTQAATAQQAGADNARQLEAVLAELRKALGPSGKVKTVNYYLNPNYHYSKDGGPPTITGYRANNTVQVTTDDLAGVGKVIDAATASGANSVQSLEFLLKNDAAVRAQALREATVEARANAEAMAAALGLRSVRVLTVEQGQPSVIRPMNAMQAEAVNRATAITPGAIEVHAVVTVTVAVQ